MDISSPPILADVNVDGKPMKVVAQPTKQGILYVFDRVTGKPVWPMPETPVEKGSVPGEWYSPTGTGFRPSPLPMPGTAFRWTTLIDFTPALHVRCGGEDCFENTKENRTDFHAVAVVSNINGPIARR